MAHSHGWKKDDFYGAVKILESLNEHQFDEAEHPSEMLDLVCIAGTASYALYKEVRLGTMLDSSIIEILAEHGLNEGVVTSYVCGWEEEGKRYLGTALGNFISSLIHRMAQQDPSLRNLADHYSMSGMASGGIATPTVWRPDVISAAVRQKARKLKQKPEKWSEWESIR